MAERYALVIGISQYKYLGNLDSVVQDVEAIASILETNKNYKVERYPPRYIEAEDRYEVKEKEVTQKVLLDKIEDFLFQTAENSDVLLYFSGHGLQYSNSKRLNPKGGLAFYNSTKDGTDILLFSDLNELFAKARNEAHLSSLIVILDCCHAGMIIEDKTSPFNQSIDKNMVQNSFSVFQEKSGYALLAACRGHQDAYFDKGGMSVLTKKIIEGLQPERAENGIITFFNLAEYVKGKLDKQGQYSTDLTIDASGLEIIKYPQTCQINGQEKANFLNNLCRLNFDREDGIFNDFLDRNLPVGAFWIRSQQGEKETQLWLIERFLRGKGGKLFVNSVNYVLAINKSYSLETLWYRFHSKFASTIDNNPTLMVEEIYTHWRNQKTVILGLIGVQNLKQTVINDFLVNIWQPLSQKAIDDQSSYPLLLLLVDTGLNPNCDHSFEYCLDYDNFCPEIPLQLTLKKLQNRAIENWIDNHDLILKQQLVHKKLSIDDFKTRIIELNQKEDTCTEDTLDTICELCSVKFRDDRIFRY